MRLTDRVISLHPAIVTAFFVVFFVGGGVAVNLFSFGSAQSMIIFSITMLASLGPLTLWHYSLYRAASDRNGSDVGRNGKRAIFFLLGFVGTFSFVVLFTLPAVLAVTEVEQQAVDVALSASIIVGNVSYFCAIWAASNALTRFDERGKTPAFHKTLGTFFLELYLPIGIWVMYPRIKRLLAAPQAR